MHGTALHTPVYRLISEKYHLAWDGDVVCVCVSPSGDNNKRFSIKLAIVKTCLSSLVPTIQFRESTDGHAVCFHK